MNKLIFTLLVLSFFACKKEENQVNVQLQSTDSTVYYSKWTKVTNNNFSHIGFNDIEVLANKKVALIGFSDVAIIDSNYSFWRSAKYFSNTYNSFKLSLESKNATVRNRFYYFSSVTSTKVPNDQILVSNELRDNEVQTDLYDRNYFINDTAKNNVYYVRSQDYDYFFYSVYKPSEKNYNYLFNYFDHNRSIYKTIEFNSVNEISNVFRSGNKIFFQTKYGNLYKVIDIVTFNLMDGSYSTDFGFIGAYNGVIYLNNKDKGIYKTTDFVSYTKVFQDNLLGQNIPYFSGKHLLYYKFNNSNYTSSDELILLDLKTNKVIPIGWKDPEFDSIQYYWVIDNVLYLLTKNNIYARKY